MVQTVVTVVTRCPPSPFFKKEGFYATRWRYPLGLYTLASWDERHRGATLGRATPQAVEGVKYTWEFAGPANVARLPATI